MLDLTPFLDYRWSSYHANACTDVAALVRPHAAYIALEMNAEQCCAAYREFVAKSSAATDLDEIRLHLQRQYAFGTNRFRASIEPQLGRRTGPAKIGHPAKPKSVPIAKESVL